MGVGLGRGQAPAPVSGRHRTRTLHKGGKGLEGHRDPEAKCRTHSAAPPEALPALVHWGLSLQGLLLLLLIILHSSWHLVPEEVAAWGQRCWEQGLGGRALPAPLAEVPNKERHRALLEQASSCW